MGEIGGARSFPRRGRWIAAAVIVVLAAALVWLQLRTPGPPGKILPPSPNALFVDEETGEESVQPASAIPPLRNPSEKPTLVRAACYSSDGGNTHLVAYYETYTPNAQALLENATQEEKEQRWREIEQGHLVRLPAKNSPWYQFQSAAGEQVKITIPQQHAGETLAPWSPP